MRVVHYLWSARPGGIERLVCDLSSAQHHGGNVEASILFGKKTGDYLEHFGKAGVPSSGAGLRSGYDLSPRKLLRLKAYFSGFDIVHLHSFHPLVAMAALLSGRPTVYTEHGYPVAAGSDFSLRAKRALKRAFLNKVAFISYNSEFTRQVFANLYGAPPVQHAVVYNGTVLTEEPGGEVDDETSEKCRGRFVVGAATRLIQRKRVARLVRVFAKFQEGRETTLLIVGDGPSRPALEAEALALGIAEKTVFSGFKEDAGAYQKLFDVSVLPSENEPFGLAVMESLALGTPTVAFEDSGGTAEILRPLEPDDVVRDESGLAARLEHYYAHRESLAGGGGERKKYASRFSIDSMKKRFGEIYAEVAK